MKLNLFHKVFSAFVITMLIAMGMLVAVMYFSVNRSFSEYLAKQQMTQLGGLAAALESLYRQQRSWEQFKDDPRSWNRFIGPYLPDPPPPPPPPPSPRHDPPPPPRPGNDQPPPPPPPPPPRDDQQSSPRREAIGPRLALFDEAKQLVAGRSGASIQDFTVRPIDVDGRTAGWLGLRPLSQLAHPLELNFILEQSRSMILAAFLIFVVAGLISFIFSKKLLAPIKKLIQGTKDVSHLNFDTRIEVRSADELGQLAKAFNSMSETLGKYESARKQWIGDVAHELRTPLAILRGEIEAMQDGVRDVNPERLASLHEETGRISRLVDDLHLLSVADSENILQQKNPVSLLALLRDIVRDFKTRMESSGIRVEMAAVEDERVVISGDEHRLRQLFSNLIENTIRYTNPPGLLRINCYHARHAVTLVFEDTPPAVPVEALGRLFDRLYRVDKSRSRAFGGSGLGLSICKEIVAGHGGTIRAAHSSLGGLLISMEFPIASQ